MNEGKYSYYRDTASMLWLGGALLLGLALALFFEADRRQALFYITFVVGVVLVVRLNRQPNQATSVDQKQAPSVSSDLIDELVQGETLTAEARREWLDRLLVKQQEDERK